VTARVMRRLTGSFRTSTGGVHDCIGRRQCDRGASACDDAWAGAHNERGRRRVLLPTETVAFDGPASGSGAGQHIFGRWLQRPGRCRAVLVTDPLKARRPVHEVAFVDGHASMRIALGDGCWTGRQETVVLVAPVVDPVSSTLSQLRTYAGATSTNRRQDENRISTVAIRPFAANSTAANIGVSIFP